MVGRTITLMRVGTVGWPSWRAGVVREPSCVRAELSGLLRANGHAMPRPY
jgi:hypothetical protein